MCLLGTTTGFILYTVQGVGGLQSQHTIGFNWTGWSMTGPTCSTINSHIKARHSARGVASTHKYWSFASNGFNIGKYYMVHMVNTVYISTAPFPTV